MHSHPGNKTHQANIPSPFVSPFTCDQLWRLKPNTADSQGYRRSRTSKRQTTDTPCLGWKKSGSKGKMNKKEKRNKWLKYFLFSNLIFLRIFYWRETVSTHTHRSERERRTGRGRGRSRIPTEQGARTPSATPGSCASRRQAFNWLSYPGALLLFF